MNFQECLQYLQKRGDEVLAMRFGLKTTRLLLQRLGRPHLQVPSVLVAGTNGKGSVARFLASILQRAGYRTALYTSPHLVRITERMRIGGSEISRAAFSKHVSRVVEAAAPDLSPTYFELLTVAAFCWFAERKAEISVLEVGMGGRLDSTNVVLPEVAVISRIGMDHRRILGETIAAIAREKAGILRKAKRAWTVQQHPDAAAALQEEAQRFGAPLKVLKGLKVLGQEDGRFRFSYREKKYRLNAFGEFQTENAGLAIAAALELSEAGFDASPQALREGVERCRIEGVLTREADSPPLFLDGGHNPQAARALVEFAESYTARPRALVFGIMRDKDVSEVLEILRPCFEVAFFVPIRSKRAAAPEECRKLFGRGEVVGEAVEGLFRARSTGLPTFATGSLYLIGELLARRGEWEKGG
ncbi:MAG TPA: folylpolyglutamate synthase/dihydrofolate synthase family protein [Acidobacteriota bacterium]|nr:folylpolyglutamate synthase/dihydrofolate synthase family protein [Acidobacteriota bacterium]